MILQEEFEEISAMLTAYNHMSLALIDGGDDESEYSFGMHLIHKLIMAKLDEVAGVAMDEADALNPRSDAYRALGLRKSLIAHGMAQAASAADLSQALNLRKASVERIIARLKGADAEARKAV